jgi:hypothetical protein
VDSSRFESKTKPAAKNQRRPHPRKKPPIETCEDGKVCQQEDPLAEIQLRLLLLCSKDVGV